MPRTTLILLSLCFSVSCSDSEDHNANELDRLSAVEDHSVVAHLNRIVIPKVDILDATPEEAFEFVQQRLMANDTEKDATYRGVSMIIHESNRQGDIDQNDYLGLADNIDENVTRISLSAENVAYLDLVEEVARQARMDAYLTSAGVVIVPEGASPFPNIKATEGETWKVIRETQVP